MFALLALLWLITARQVEGSTRAVVLLVSSDPLSPCTTIEEVTDLCLAPQVPVALVGLFGAYSVGAVALGVANFPSRPEEAAALKQVRPWCFCLPG